MRGCEERQDEDVAVPEDVSSVAAPASPRAPGRLPSSATDAIRWKRVKRIASCRSGSPSTTTSAVARRRAQAARCSTRSARSRPPPRPRVRRLPPAHRLRTPRDGRAGPAGASRRAQLGPWSVDHPPTGWREVALASLRAEGHDPGRARERISLRRCRRDAILFSGRGDVPAPGRRGDQRVARSSLGPARALSGPSPTCPMTRARRGRRHDRRAVAYRASRSARPRW